MNESVTVTKNENSITGYVVCGAYTLNKDINKKILHAAKIWRVVIPNEELKSTYTTYLEETLDMKWRPYYIISSLLFLMAFASWWSMQSGIFPQVFLFSLVLCSWISMFFLFKGIVAHSKYLYQTRRKTADLFTKENISKCLTGKGTQLINLLVNPGEQAYTNEFRLPKTSKETDSMLYMIVSAAETKSELKEASPKGWKTIIYKEVDK